MNLQIIKTKKEERRGEGEGEGEGEGKGKGKGKGEEGVDIMVRKWYNRIDDILVM